MNTITSSHIVTVNNTSISKNVRMLFKGVSAIMLIMPLLISAQISIIYTNEPAMLVADGYKHGDIQWQSSSDKINWTDIAGYTSDSVQFVPDTIVVYYRALITSGSCNTIYSDTQGIKLFQCGDTIIDYRDGRAYPTVQIGSQCWMASNLAVGEMIDGGLNMADNQKIERYCFNNDTTNCDHFGALYQWDEMMQYTTVEGAQGICPKGWHIPSDAEWITLELQLGMIPASTTVINFWRGTDQGWQLSPSGTSGFNANYSGVRYDSGMFYNQSTFEFIYTSTTNSSNPSMKWRRCLSISDQQIGRFNNTYKTTGSSVRCVKD